MERVGAENDSGIQQMAPNASRSQQTPPPPTPPPPPPQDCFLKVKISRVLEPFLPTGGGVVVDFGEGEGVEDGEGEEGWGVEVPP